MKKQIRLSSSQRKVLVSRFREQATNAWNAEYAKRQKPRAKVEAARKAEYEAKLRKILKAPTPTQVNAFVALTTDFYNADKSLLSIETLCPLPPDPVLDAGIAHSWRREDSSHPVDKLAQDFDFQLVMAEASGWEDLEASFSSRLKELLK